MAVSLEKDLFSLLGQFTAVSSSFEYKEEVFVTYGISNEKKER